MTGSARARQVIQDVLSKLVAEYAPQQVILFGSYAYGEPNEGSDIDLLIVKDTDKRPLERRMEVKRCCEIAIGPCPCRLSSTHARNSISGSPSLRIAIHLGRQQSIVEKRSK